MQFLFIDMQLNLQMNTGGEGSFFDAMEHIEFMLIATFLWIWILDISVIQQVLKRR